MMEVKIQKEATETVVWIEGRVDTVSAPDLEKVVFPLLDEPCTLVFDCASLEYISSSGLRIILTVHKTLTAKGGKFILRNISKEVYQVFVLTGFSHILTIQ
jgi:anti-anti-sigma factor